MAIRPVVADGEVVSDIDVVAGGGVGADVGVDRGVGVGVGVAVGI